MPNEPTKFAPDAFPTHTCPKIDSLVKELREAQEAAKDDDAERVRWLLSDWEQRLEELRAANLQLREAAGGYRDNRNEWMAQARTLQDELETVQDQLEDCKRELDNERSNSLHQHNRAYDAEHRAAALERQLHDAEHQLNEQHERHHNSGRGRESFGGYPW